MNFNDFRFARFGAFIDYDNFCVARIVAAVALDRCCARNHTVRNVWRAPFFMIFSSFCELFEFVTFSNTFWPIVLGTPP